MLYTFFKLKSYYIPIGFMIGSLTCPLGSGRLPGPATGGPVCELTDIQKLSPADQKNIENTLLLGQVRAESAWVHPPSSQLWLQRRLHDYLYLPSTTTACGN